MAGFAAQNSGIVAPPGTKFDTRTGTFVPLQSDDPYTEGARSTANAGAAATSAYGTAQATGSDFSVGPTGETSYSNNTASDTNKAKLQAEAEARRWAQVQGLFGTGPNQLGPQVSHPGDGGAEAAAQASSQARFKEKVGQVGRGAMTALKETMAGRGMSGSGLEGELGTNVINSGQSDLINKISSDEAATLKRGYDVNDQVYQGNIQQRGQLAQMYPSLMGVIASRLY